MVRVEVVETSSQVWKTCILTAVLHSQYDHYIIFLRNTAKYAPVLKNKHIFNHLIFS